MTDQNFTEFAEKTFDSILPRMLSDSGRARFISDAINIVPVPEKYIDWTIDYLLSPDEEGEPIDPYRAAELARKTKRYGKAVDIWLSLDDMRALEAAEEGGLLERKNEILNNWVARELAEGNLIGDGGAAELAKENGRPEEARGYYLRFVEEAESSKDPEDLIEAGAVCTDKLKDAERAKKLYQTSFNMLLEQGKKREAAKVAKEGGLEQALPLYEELIQEKIDAGKPINAAYLAGEAGMVDRQIELLDLGGRTSDAADCAYKAKRFEKAVELKLKAGINYGAVNILKELNQFRRAGQIEAEGENFISAARLYKMDGDYKSAEDMYRKAIQEEEKCGEWGLAKNYSHEAGFEELENLYRELEGFSGQGL